MSSLIIVDAGEALFLSRIVGLAYTLHLYTNDVTAGLTPDEIDELVVGDFTEATFPGYAAAALGTGDWTVTEGNPSSAVNLPKSFVRSSTGTPETIRGYYITVDAFAGALVGFEALDGPIVVENINDEVIVPAAITLDDTEANVLPTGSILAYGADAAAGAPNGWLLCDGSAVSRTTYAELFAVIGLAYGIGDGATTFNLPDMRQRFPLGQAASGTGVNVGDTGGAIDHVHPLDSASSAALVRASSATETLRSSLKTIPSWTPNASLGSLTAIADASITQGTELTGDTDTANPPFLTVGYIIKA